MKKCNMNKMISRMIAVVIAVIMAVTVVPAMGVKVNAEYTSSNVNTYYAPNANGTFNVESTSFSYYPYASLSNITPFLMGRSNYIRLEFSNNNWQNWYYSSPIYYNGVTTAYNIGRTFKDLQPDTTYQTRICYCDYNGNRLSPYRTTTTIKTGKAKAPAIKSVKVKAVKIKYHNEYVPGHYEFTAMGSPYWIHAYRRKYYTYKLRVTVKLKKKPGTAGLYINGKYVKGNKKKYVTTITPYSNIRVKRPPKGMKKYTVTIKSYQNQSYNGFSPATKRKRKVK